MWFKIKRPDYGSGQLERDLIFLRLKDLFDTLSKARAMPPENTISGVILRVAAPKVTTPLGVSSAVS